MVLSSAMQQTSLVPTPTIFLFVFCLHSHLSDCSGHRLLLLLPLGSVLADGLPQVYPCPVKHLFLVELRVPDTQEIQTS